MFVLSPVCQVIITTRNAMQQATFYCTKKKSRICVSYVRYDYNKHTNFVVYQQCRCNINILLSQHRKCAYIFSGILNRVLQTICKQCQNRICMSLLVRFQRAGGLALAVTHKYIKFPCAVLKCNLEQICRQTGNALRCQRALLPSCVHVLQCRHIDWFSQYNIYYVYRNRE